MVNVKHQTCIHEGCKIRPTYNVEGKTNGVYCTSHKKEGMLDVKTKRCEHGKLKSRCKPCGGSSFCEHGKLKAQCKPCGGSSFCEHGKRKAFCKQCHGSGICQHGRRKVICKQCDCGHHWTDESE